MHLFSPGLSRSANNAAADFGQPLDGVRILAVEQMQALPFATQLLARVETYAAAHGAKRLCTDASDLARPAFERAGYRMTERREFTIPHEGRKVPIHNWAMEKTLR